MKSSELFDNLRRLKPYEYKYLYLYSDFRSLEIDDKSWNKSAFLNNLTECLLQIAPNIVIPSFTYTSEGTFDPDRDRTNLGALNRHIQADSRSFTSSHPMFSFSGIGPEIKNILGALGPKAFGQGSLYEAMSSEFAFVHIGRPPMLGNKLVHHVEAVAKVPYRTEVYFATRVYRGGREDGRVFSAFMRSLEDVRLGRHATDFREAADQLINKKVYCPILYRSLYESIWVASAVDVRDSLTAMIQSESGIFLSRT
jgi:aminoglycoside N3'-acetyltransferase